VERAKERPQAGDFTGDAAHGEPAFKKVPQEFPENPVVNLLKGGTPTTSCAAKELSKLTQVVLIGKNGVGGSIFLPPE
jgi:hypothetical protein